MLAGVDTLYNAAGLTSPALSKGGSANEAHLAVGHRNCTSGGDVGGGRDIGFRS